MEDISENDVDNVVLDNAMEDLWNEGASEEDELEKKNEYVECETSELIHKEVANDEEAYKLYNEYAFKCGFGIRKGKVCWRYETKTIRQRFLVCSREGLKDTKGGVPKAFTKLDQRCGCKAFIQFDVSKDFGIFIVTKHHMIHNHPMVPLNQRHLIRSHRKVTVEQLHMINNLRSCGVGVAEAVRVLRKEAGGSPNLGFVNRDAYDAVATQRKKELDVWHDVIMVTKYKCAACPWLIRLYKLRKMWCPVYSKDYFSGGVLSSQRSETTNHSLNQRLHSMQGLCDFYKVFIDVVEEWRDRENGEDYNALNGNKHLAFVDVKLLNEAKKIYTVAVYLTFEENFIRGASFCQKLVKYDPPLFEYHVGRTEKEYLMHLVRYDQENMTIDCTCKYFTEMGLLCSHSLRIFHIHDVEKIPQRYILGRWAKHAMCTRVDDDAGKDVNIVQASVWRVKTTRDALSIINSTQHDIAARKVVENALSDLKAKVGST
ncbi:protein FAR1-RELATED SEQUENCE 5-like [Beta vulgaris subsp. vulgaris]|uniref:protein FAR1-RELATED SEQUENCE 5-like n=1 Tax=Beta vulgaris subsp. vulgaris TaxID=3555 RepID=UPI0025492DD2|nr:protein FAR1-RELATED SEQUENCE 5-like [Beta vulgaris subsp. vulgaris]